MAINSINDLRKALTFDFDAMLNKVMLSSKVKKEIIELNQVEQLAEGIDALGQKIITISAQEQNAGNVYSWQSVHERSKESLQVRNVDLKITGTLWDTFDLKAVSEGWEVVAKWDIHGDDVRDHFTSKFDFAGLTQDNLEFFVFDTLIPELQKEFDREIKKRS